MDHYERSSRNGFAGYVMERATHRRRDGAWIELRLHDPTTRLAPVWEAKNLFTEGDVPRALLLSPAQMGGLLARAVSVTFLGENEDGAVTFAVGLPCGGEAPTRALAGLGRFRDLRSVGALLGARDGVLLAYARAMATWHERHRFCGECGSPTESREAGHLRVCTNPDCGAHHFPRTDPAVIVRVTSADGLRVLLGRKREWRGRMRSVVAGFVEPGETLEAAVVREVAEETGVRVERVCYFASQPWPFPASLMLGFTARVASEEVCLNDGELEEAGWFSREEIVAGLAAGTLGLPSPISISYRLIEAWFDAGGVGRLGEVCVQ